MISFLGRNYKIEFILDDVVRVESRTFSLLASAVSGGGSSGGGGGGSSSVSVSSQAAVMGAAAQIMTIVVSCLMGGVLLLEYSRLQFWFWVCIQVSTDHFVYNLCLHIRRHQWMFPRQRLNAQHLCVAPPGTQRHSLSHWESNSFSVRGKLNPTGNCSHSLHIEKCGDWELRVVSGLSAGCRGQKLSLNWLRQYSELT